MRPVNLNDHSGFNVAFAGAEISSKMKSINEKNVAEKIVTCINHFKVCSIKLKEEITLLKSKLREICCPGRFDFLINKLELFKEKTKAELDRKKRKKLQKLKSSAEAMKITINNTNDWLPHLNLTKDDELAIINSCDLTDQIITAAANLIQKQFDIIIQPPGLVHATGFDYCPMETVQIVHNGAHHWLLLSSVKGVISIYDSMNSQPTELVVKQMKQLFSPDNGTLNYVQRKCHKQIGGNDCGLFAIAYAIDILTGNDPDKIRYDQTRMRHHLIACFKSGKVTPFPKYRTNEEHGRNSKCVATTQADWITPTSHRYNLRSSQRSSTASMGRKEIPLKNRFSLLSPNSRSSEPIKDIKINDKNNNANKYQISQVVHNLSQYRLSSEEMALLEKGLNFSPSAKEINKEELLDDVFSYCRNVRLRHFFHNDEKDKMHVGLTTKNSPKSNQEQCEMKSQVKNPYFYPSLNSASPNLEKYIASTKSDIKRLIEKQGINHQSNLSSSERLTLKSLKERNDILITTADKGGKVVILDKEEYKTNCIDQLNNKEFYKEIENNPTEDICNEINSTVNNMLKEKYITEKESKTITEHLSSPRLCLFYGLPKIHKFFKDFPPLRPIVSGFNSCTARLSEYLDTFLKYQATKSKSYIRDTKDFLVKLDNLKELPSNSILVTMDISSLYTNIDHEEGSHACFEHLERRKHKKVPSSVLKKLIHLVLSSNVFRFNNRLYKQIKGTAMGTPMAVNYANLFLDKFETEMLSEFEKEFGMKPLVWMRYIDDIFSFGIKEKIH